MQAAVSASERDQAEQARLSAYAFFEFGPEITLRAFDPALVAEVEGLMWYGARGVDGLAELISGDRSVADLRETRLVLDEALDEARAKTGEGASKTTVITNAAMIVFREGLEAILIIAAITASMIGARRGLRRPILRGALLALPASVLLWFIAQLVLDSFSQYGERLEAVVGLIAIAVLLLVLNWFFHRVYWTEWIAGHRQRGMAMTSDVGVSAAAGVATIAGLYMLGFSSVLREGFETVLFLQALQLSSGTGAVVAGVGMGLVATFAVGALTFALERRLPYKRMLVVTGVLIAVVLVVLVGNTMRTLQGVGWLSITPLDVEFPLWMGTWLGVFPTVETLVAQALAFAFVIGSYFAAEWYRKRHLRRAARELRERDEAPAQVEAEPEPADREPDRELAAGVTRSRV
jgi:high-affinity iron transporter